MRTLRAILLTLVAVMATLSAAAQATTASLTGFVTDSEGRALVGATVVATHTPTETIYGTTTDANGTYRLQGLRVGGPYTVEISFVGYKDKKITDITLSLGENRQIDTKLDNAQIERSEEHTSELQSR